jgi:hypothetical protein
VPLQGNTQGGSGSTEQYSVLEIKSGLSDTDVNSRVIYRGRSESEAEYEKVKQ